MPDEVARIVLLPRYSAFVGARTFNTTPLDVSQFASANVSVWRGSALGTSPTFQLIVQQSMDLATWYDLATISPSANSESDSSVTFTMAWMRVAVTLGGTTPSMNCWAVGDFLRRAA